MEFDGGLGTTVRVDEGLLEIRTETATRTLSMDDVAGSTVKGGRWSSRGSLGLQMSDGETVTVPFTRENRAQALQLRQRIQLRRRRAEAQRGIEEFRQRRLREIEQDRQLYAGKAERGEITTAAHEAFEREVADTIAELEQQVELRIQEFDSAARRFERTDTDHP